MSDVGGKKRQLTNCEWLDSIVKFKAHFGCRDCMYKDECHKCFINGFCIINGYPETADNIEPVSAKCNNCPYSNSAGTCFGFCIRAILNDYKKRFKNGGS